MTSFTDDNIDKPSYKCVVADGPVKSKGDKAGETFVPEVLFDVYERVVIDQQVARKGTHTRDHLACGNKRRFLVEILEPLADVTLDINTFFGFHGIGDSLSVGSVLDCLDASIRTDYSTSYKNDESEAVSDDE